MDNATDKLEIPVTDKKKKKAITTETFVFLILFSTVIGYLGSIMGIGPMVNTMMKTAHDLLLNTVFFIMAIAVLAGGLSALWSEFGVIALVNRLVSPIMKPLYNLPGAASIGAITTFLSDNPAIISLTNDKGFLRYFRNYQVPTLCNLGTAYGMGLILCTYMISVGTGTEYAIPVAAGFFGAVVGSVVSVRLMMGFTKKFYGITREKIQELDSDSVGKEQLLKYREVREGNALERALEAILDGGKSGVEMGMAIIPGVVFICTFVMILTLRPGVGADGLMAFTGSAYEGVALLPKLGALLSPILTPLFGFTSPEAIAFPITSLGSVGAAMGMIPRFISEGIAGPNEIAVFTAMGMCWSGYLSTHVGMMDALGVRKLTNKAIFSHTIGGISAGVAAHYLLLLVNMFN